MATANRCTNRNAFTQKILLALLVQLSQMSSTVRFLDTHNQTKKVSSYSDGTQTIPIEFNSSGTDPVAAPEKGIQTDQRFLWNKTAAQSLRIDAQLVDNILKELGAVEREWPLF